MSDQIILFNRLTNFPLLSPLVTPRPPLLLSMLWPLRHFLGIEYFSIFLFYFLSALFHDFILFDHVVVALHDGRRGECRKATIIILPPPPLSLSAVHLSLCFCKRGNFVYFALAIRFLACELSSFPASTNEKENTAVKRYRTLLRGIHKRYERVLLVRRSLPFRHVVRGFPLFPSFSVVIWIRD